jgi:putative transposase
MCGESRLGNPETGGCEEIDSLLRSDPLSENDADRRIYLELLQENLRLHEVLLVGYCLMFDHVHLVVIPGDVEGLALSMKHTHGRYASYWNMVHNSSGHAWQGR